MSEFDQLSPSVLRDALIHAPIGIGVVDMDGRFLLISRALARLLGREVEQILGRPFLAFVHPDDRARSAAEYFEAVAAAAAGVPSGSTTIRCTAGGRKSVLLDVCWTVTEADHAGNRAGVIYLANHRMGSGPDCAGEKARRRHGLTAREVQVLEFVMARYDNIDIATRLHVSKRTVESHVASLLRKFAVPNRRALRSAVARAGEGHDSGRRLAERPTNR